jgi:hypothetical protein
VKIYKGGELFFAKGLIGDKVVTTSGARPVDAACLWLMAMRDEMLRSILLLKDEESGTVYLDKSFMDPYISTDPDDENFVLTYGVLGERMAVFVRRGVTTWTVSAIMSDGSLVSTSPDVVQAVESWVSDFICRRSITVSDDSGSCKMKLTHVRNREPFSILVEGGKR